MTVGKAHIVCYNLFCVRIPAHISNNNSVCKNSTFTCIFYTGKQRYQHLPPSAHCYTLLAFKPAQQLGFDMTDHNLQRSLPEKVVWNGQQTDCHGKGEAQYSQWVESNEASPGRNKREYKREWGRQETRKMEKRARGSNENLIGLCWWVVFLCHSNPRCEAARLFLLYVIALGRAYNK